jgi:hypothetical protein
MELLLVVPARRTGHANTLVIVPVLREGDAKGQPASLLRAAQLKSFDHGIPQSCDANS